MAPYFGEGPFVRYHAVPPYRGTVRSCAARIALSLRGERRLYVFVIRECEAKGRGNVFSC